MVEFLQDYQACLNQAVYYPVENAGVLKLTGRDFAAFVQRQTTNNVDQISAETGQVSVLTSPTGRILDMFFLFKPPDPAGSALTILPLPDRAASTARYLKSRIFFMDQVTLQDQSTSFWQVIIDGPQGANALHQAGCGDSLPLTDGVISTTLAGAPVTIIGWRGLAGHAFRLLASVESKGTIQSAFQEAHLLELSRDSQEILRIEAGLPGVNGELTEEYNPLEVGLPFAVSANKGCYTGQEVIARQVNYDKITRQLVGLYVENQVQAGSEVLAEDRPVGRITSSAQSPRLGALALAVLKRPYFEEGCHVQIMDGEKMIQARVSNLPFPL